MSLQQEQWRETVSERHAIIGNENLSTRDDIMWSRVGLSEAHVAAIWKMPGK